MSNFDMDLTPLIEKCSNEDLEPLVGYIKKADWTEGLTNKDLYKFHNPDHKKYASLIENEIREFGGNSFVNVFRGTGPSYAEVVRDVADKLKANYNKKSSTADVENAILIKVASDAWDKMSEEERRQFLNEMGIGIGSGSIPKALPVAALQVAIKASGFLAYKLALIIANAIAKVILGRGLMFGTNMVLARSIAVFAGPIGWIITGLWTAIDLAGPAYRVTIPCVVHIAMLRQKLLSSYCPSCNEPCAENAAFCSVCGAELSQRLAKA